MSKRVRRECVASPHRPSAISPLGSLTQRSLPPQNFSTLLSEKSDSGILGACASSLGRGEGRGERVSCECGCEMRLMLKGSTRFPVNTSSHTHRRKVLLACKQATRVKVPLSVVAHPCPPLLLLLWPPPLPSISLTSFPGLHKSAKGSARHSQLPSPPDTVGKEAPAAACKAARATR